MMVERTAPELTPWLPLIAGPFAADVASTGER